MTYDQFCQLVDNCEECSLFRSVHVPGVGNSNARIMFIAEAPGAVECIQKTPLVGPAGQLFRQLLAQADIPISDVYLTNTVKCRPMSGPANRTPLPAEVAACAYILDAEIAMVNPQIIVCTGAVAMRAILGITSGITQVHGTWHRLGNRDVTVIYHPSYLLRIGTDTPLGTTLANQVLSALHQVVARANVLQ